MGQHAQDFINDCIDEECLRDDYSYGDMSDQDAFDHGFLDSSGHTIGMDDAFDRIKIYTASEMESELRMAEYELTCNNYRYDRLASIKHSGEDLEVDIIELNDSGIKAGNTDKNLTNKAVANLYKPVPTCNICEEFMVTRYGTYGKFYYCKCEGQPNVSDKYWQKVRLRMEDKS